MSALKKKYAVDVMKDLQKLDAVELAHPKKIPAVEIGLLTDLEEAVDFVSKYKKGNARAKSISQLLDEV